MNISLSPQKSDFCLILADLIVDDVFGLLHMVWVYKPAGDTVYGLFSVKFCVNNLGSKISRMSSLWVDDCQKKKKESCL